jgi:AraC-like DNA-binding protein
MMIKHFRVPGVLRSKMEEAGVPVAAVLRKAGLPQDTFAKTRILVSTEELFALWHAIGEVSGDAAIGLKLGTETRIEQFHPMVLAALSTDNFGEAVEHIARYKRLCAPEEIVHDMDAVEWSIQFRWTLTMAEEPKALVDFCFAWVMNIARHGTGTRLTPLRVELVQRRGSVKELGKYFGCPVQCGSSRNAIVFRAGDAQAQFVTRNAELLEMLAPQFERELKLRADSEVSFTGLVRGAIEQKLTGHRPAMDDVARGLHMSSRTLQRRLQEAGTSFQRVLDEARRHMARYYLGNSELELSETAYLLGYEDANSFARAFRGWEGVPPSDWRETHKCSVN